MLKLNLNKTLLITGIMAFAFLVAFLLWWQWDSNIIGIKNEGQSASQRTASLTGLICENYERRPVAVMMASDPITRPLSGISQADIVIEMPVTPNGITRMMAIFQCEEPEEIGSIRSAREDFLTLVDSFGALYAHWGGEREALNKLDNGILDNIDAMKYEGTVFYRKTGVRPPHNGFTDLGKIFEISDKLGYELKDTFGGYPRGDDEPERNLNNMVSAISVDYENPYDVKWVYDSGSNNYKRIRGGEAEMDKNTGEQVKTSVVVLMHAMSRFLNIDYISVKIAGEGEAEFYQNGIKTSGTWRNNNNDLRFYDTNGQETKFVPGKMWIEIITSD